MTASLFAPSLCRTLIGHANQLCTIIMRGGIATVVSLQFLHLQVARLFDLLLLTA